VRVELRKLVDTRSGGRLLAAIALGTVATVAVYVATHDEPDLTFERFVNVTVMPQALLLPVLGIMTVTSGWTHRTGLVTAGPEPRRGRVLAAKVAATGVLGALAVGLVLAVAAVANVLVSALLHGDGSWDYGVGDLRDTLLFQLLALLQGLALGVLVVNTVAAVVLHFALPIVSGLVFGLVDSLAGVAGWIDPGTSHHPLFWHSIDGVEWLQLLATTTWWIALPLAAGTWRLLHREIR
jgi:hypothetical protein